MPSVEWVCILTGAAPRELGKSFRELVVMISRVGKELHVVERMEMVGMLKTR